MNMLTEVRYYVGFCEECGARHEHEVRVRADGVVRLSDHAIIACCGRQWRLQVVAREIRRPFERLRALFRPSEVRGGRPAPRPPDEVAALRRGEEPWTDLVL